MDTLRIGQRVGDHVVDSLIGRGTSTEVYLVRHDDGTWWALKVILDPHPTRADRLRREAVVRHGLTHPHIVPAHEVIDAGGYPALVMDFIEGPSLRTWLRGHTPDLRQAVSIVGGITQGIAAAHAAGIIHRDLRPENVMLQPRPDGTLVPRVSDWGLARTLEVGPMGGLTTVDRGLGAPGYTAPEQARDATSVTPASDVFSLGCILYELLAGVGPFAGQTEMEAALAAKERAWVPLAERVKGLPPGLVELVESMLDPSPARRPVDAGEVWRRLLALDLSGEEGWNPLSWMVMAAIPPLAALCVGWLVVTG